jgi:hypothetical protein
MRKVSVHWHMAPRWHARHEQGWSDMANTRQDLAAGAAELEQLAGQLDGQTYAVALLSGDGKRPRLHISNRRAGQLAEYVYSDGESFYWGWAQVIAPITDLAAAAAAIDRVLRTLSGNR